MNEAYLPLRIIMFVKEKYPLCELLVFRKLSKKQRMLLLFSISAVHKDLFQKISQTYKSLSLFH